MNLYSVEDDQPLFEEFGSVPCGATRPGPNGSWVCVQEFCDGVHHYFVVPY